MKQWCIDQSIHWTSPKYMVLNIKVKEQLWKEVETLNEPLPNHQKVKKIQLLGEEWTVESHQLSPTQKLLRQKIVADCKKEIERMYE